MNAEHPRRVWICIGPSGAGKSTLAQALSARLGCPFVEADDLHPPTNIKKMEAGQPLVDADREPWLTLVARAIRQALTQAPQVVVACSALKRRYRDQLMEESGEQPLFIYAPIDRSALEARLVHRRGHFMPASLLDSQIEAFEPPQADEDAIVLPATADVETLVGLCLQAASGTPSTWTR